MISRPVRLVRVRQNNLKNVTVEFPARKLSVVTGLSGSGKSSLVFDTLYAEGQRRYVESLSTYTRQFLEKMPKPDLDSIAEHPARHRARAEEPRRQLAQHGRHPDRDRGLPARALRARSAARSAWTAASEVKKHGRPERPRLGRGLASRPQGADRGAGRATAPSRSGARQKGKKKKKASPDKGNTAARAAAKSPRSFRSCSEQGFQRVLWSSAQGREAEVLELEDIDEDLLPKRQGRRALSSSSTA